MGNWVYSYYDYDKYGKKVVFPMYTQNINNMRRTKTRAVLTALCIKVDGRARVLSKKGNGLDEYLRKHTAE
jgi:hypothetical protein